MITPELIAQIRATLDAATPGEWREGTFNVWYDDGDLLICDLGMGVRYHYDGGIRNYMRQDTEDRALVDSRLIPLLRNHAPALLDEIERLQAELKRWTGVFTGVTPEDMRQRMMDMSVAHAWLSEENFRLTAYVAELEEKLETTCGECAWRQGEYTGAYHTACGHMWQFTEGDIADNDTRYCPYCGGKIVQEAENETPNH